MVPNIVIFHCSGTPDYNEGEIGFDRFRAHDIDVWHRARGWNKIGYHYVITRAGIIEEGRKSTEIGAHCEGYNRHSLGICYIGTKIILPKQITALRSLFVAIKKEYLINSDQWYCHNDFNQTKLCPGFDRTTLKKLLD